MSRHSGRTFDIKRPPLAFLRDRFKAAFLVFLLALLIRFATINKIGKTWDEGAYVELGHRYIELASKLDFSNRYWYLQSDHPPLARYIYGFASILDIEKSDTVVVFKNSFTSARVVSIVLASLTVFFIVLIGYEYFSPFVGVSSGVIFALIPFFLGLSQLATLESPIMFFFTGTVYFFLKFLENTQKKHLIFASIELGLSILVKQSNVILIPLIFLLILIKMYFMDKQMAASLSIKYLKSFLLMLFIALATCFVLWPMPFFHIGELLNVQNKMWVHAVRLPPPEVYFGVLRFVPKQYYVVMFLITTPVLLLFLGFLGGIKALSKKKFITIAILIWFLFPFIQSLYSFRQHGVRYIIEIYAPFSLLCGIGLENTAYILRRITYIKTILLLCVVAYLLLTLWKVSPYYLDYFNETVGGSKGVYDKKLFQMGWWGQGIEEATTYISNQEFKQVKVAIDGLQAQSVMPKYWNIKPMIFNELMSFDYVIVPYFSVVRLGFNETKLKGKYHEVYDVLVDKAPLVKVYKKN